MTILEFIGDKAEYDSDGTYIWGTKLQPERDGKVSKAMQMIGEVRGWGAIQNLFPGRTLEAAKFQDDLGEWIVTAINEKLEREKNNQPPVTQDKK